MSNSEYGQYSGESIQEMMWEELDGVMALLMANKAKDVAYAKGRAYGLATALALLQTPYDPNVDSVRAQAMARWEASHGRPGIRSA